MTWILAVLIAGGCVWLYLATRPSPQRPGRGQTAATSVRTVRVQSGAVERTIRLTGVTAAENYAAMISPRLRGGRGGTGQAVSQISTSAGRIGTSSASSQGSSSASGSSTSSSGSTFSGTSAASSSSVGAGQSAGASSSSSSVAGTPPSSSPAFRAATSRFSTPASSSSRSSASQGMSTAGTSEGAGTMGSSGLGSTGDNLPGGRSGPPSAGSGGGGGGGGFGSDLILQQLVKPGARVKKGDVMAEFDRQDALLRLDDFRVHVTQAATTIKDLNAQLVVIRKAHEHSIRASKAELDKAELDLKTIPVRSANATEMLQLAAQEAEATHKQLLSEVKLMEQSLTAQMRVAELVRQEAVVEMRRVQANVDRMVVRAPIKGLAVMESIWRGGEQSQIQQGDQVHPGQPFMRVVDPDSMLVRAGVNQVDAELIRIGARARVRFDAYPELELPATVFSIGAMPRTTGWRANWVKEIAVTLKLDQLDPRVIPDLSASVDVILESEQSPAVVSREAIFTDNAGSTPFVLVQRPSGWERREIDLGLASHVTVAVRRGLQPGEVVAAERPPGGAKN